MYSSIQVSGLIGSTHEVTGTTVRTELSAPKTITLGTISQDGGSGMWRAVASGEMTPEGWTPGPISLGSYAFRDEALAAVVATVLTPHRPAVPR